MHWQIDESLEALELPGDTVLQIMRVLQEAATNIVKHAHATEARVSASASTGPNPQLILEIADNGRGLPACTVAPNVNAIASANQGRSIRNMQHRAALIGASLTLGEPAGGGPGTTVRLVLQLG